MNDIGPYLKALITLIGNRVVAHSVGTTKYLAQLFFKFGGQYIYEKIMTFLDRSEKKKVIEEAAKKQEESVAKDQELKTDESEKERRNAFKDGINK